MCEDFFELRGDRHYGDDRAIQGGVACLSGRAVVILGHQKGRDTRERMECNFGMAHPEGYRKAMGRQRRRAGHHRRRPHPDAGALDLYRRVSRGGGLDSLARLRIRRQRRRDDEDHRARFA